MVKIGITGTPGTGKSTVARLLSKELSLPLVDVNSIAQMFVVDLYKDSKLVDMDRLEKELIDVIGNRCVEGCIIESHLICEMHLPLDVLVVLRCHPAILRQRLVVKGWDEDKIETNVQAEALDYCLIKSEHNYSRVYQVDTSNRTPEEVVSRVMGVIHGRVDQDFVDWSGYLVDTL